MFDHIRSRNRSAAVFMISLAVFVPALVLPRSGEDLVARKMVLFLSLGVMLISAVWLLVRWDEARRLVRLRSGVGVLARWTIDPARWEWFRHHSNEWDKLKGVRPNDAGLAQDPGKTGIEVVVARDSILIGEDFWPLEKDVRITVRADWMEFFQTIPKADGPPIHMVLRLPLQPGCESVAADIQQAYGRAHDEAKSSRRPVICVLLFCFVGLPAITALIWYLAKITGWVE
jgi:hypothetical protein